jgi:hypothetical protein
MGRPKLFVAMAIVGFIVFVIISLADAQDIPPVDNPEDYKQVTISIPDHGINATFYVYKDMKPFYDKKPYDVVHHKLSHAYIVGYLPIDGYGYDLVIDPSGTKVVSIAEYDIKGRSSQWFILFDDGYTRTAEKDEVREYIMLLGYKWRNQYTGM